MSAPVVRTAEQVPDLRLWLLDQWTPGHTYHRAFTRHQIHTPRFHEWEYRNLSTATLWWVAEDMVDVLLAAADSIPEDVRMEDVVPAAGSGLVVFAKPWWGTSSLANGLEMTPEVMLAAAEAEGGVPRQLKVDGFHWGPVRLLPTGEPAVGFSSYCKVNYSEGLSPDELRHTSALGAHEAADVTMHDARTAKVTGEVWVPLGRSDWPTSDAVGDVDKMGHERTPDGGLTPSMRISLIEDRKLLVAFWTLIAQEGVAQRTVTHPARPVMRRTERARIARELAAVQVVTLRRPKRAAGDEPGAAAEHDHRWLVSGHWRLQPVGPGRAERRLTWVRPHVKGPEGAPLHTPTRVNAWVR